MYQLQHKNSSKGPLWLVESKYLIGSGSDCDVTISGNGVREKHAELLVDGDHVSIVNLAGANLSVNGQLVNKTVDLLAGSSISIGGEVFELVDPKAKAKAQVESSSSTEKASKGWALKALNTALADKHFPLRGSQVIGRSKECDVSLGVVHLSRKHAKISVTDRGLLIEDLNSSNGTYINAKKVSRGTANAGDEISFDTMRFRVIGPVIDDDKTTVRPSSSDGDVTTVRPALNIPQTNTASVKGQGKPSRPKPQTAASHATREQQSSVTGNAASTEPRQTSGSEESGSKGVGIAVAAVLLVVAGAGAWFFLK